MAGKKSRIDIEIAASETFIIHIESKIFAPESPNETRREWDDLQDGAVELGVRPESCHAIFLTLDGSIAGDEEHFLPVAWGRIARVADKFADQAEATDVVLFARHYANAAQPIGVPRYSGGQVTWRR